MWNTSRGEGLLDSLEWSIPAGRVRGSLRLVVVGVVYMRLEL
jgi:hypothetical protein